MADNDEIDYVITALSVAYPQQNLRADKDALKATVQLYRQTLRDIDGTLLYAATLQHISSNKWFPTISELRDAAYALIRNGEPSAEEAWNEVVQEIKRAYIYKPYQFSDERIKCTVESIGWHNICLSENIGIERAHFFRTYTQLSNRTKDIITRLPAVQQMIDQLADVHNANRLIGSPKDGNESSIES